MLRLLIVLLCAAASCAACSPFFAVAARARQNDAGYWRTLGRAYTVWGVHVVLCAVIVVLCTRAAELYPKFAGAAFASGCAVFLARGVVRMFRGKKRARLVRGVCCFCLNAAAGFAVLPLCRRIPVGALFFPAALSPVTVWLCLVIDRVFQAAARMSAASSARKKRARLGGAVAVLIMGKQSGALCAHILCQILQLSGKSVAETEFALQKRGNDAAFAAARMVLDAADSTTHALVFYCPSNDHRIVRRVQSILSPQITILTAEDDEARTTLLQTMKDARGCLLRSGTVTPLALACAQRTYGVNADCDVHAQNLHLLRDGTRFLISDRRLGQATNCYMPLIGRESVEAACGAAAAAQLFGLSAETVAQALSQVRPLPGHMAVLRKNGVTWIDERGETNLVGLIHALETFRAMEAYRHIVYLQTQSARKTFEIDADRLAREIKKSADAVLLCETGTGRIYDALLGAGMPHDAVLRIETAERADEKLETIVAAGDVVMQCRCK